MVGQISLGAGGYGAGGAPVDNAFLHAASLGASQLDSHVASVRLTVIRESFVAVNGLLMRCLLDFEDTLAGHTTPALHTQRHRFDLRPKAP